MFFSINFVWFDNCKLILDMWKIYIDIFNVTVIMRRNEKYRGDVAKGE